MPYNYLDFIRDQYRRQQGEINRRRANRSTGPTGDPNEGRLVARELGRRVGAGALNYPTRSSPSPYPAGDTVDAAAPFGRNRGEPLGPNDVTGQYLFRNGAEGNIRDVSAVSRPSRLRGTGITDTEYKAIDYNPSAPTTYNAINAAPARQAIDTAVAGNAKLGNTGNRTVVNDNGTQTTYFASGGSATAKLPFGTNVSRTDNGHSVLDFPNGGRRIVSAEGQAFDYKPGSIVDNTKDFSNPVLNPNQAANYLSSNSAVQALLPQSGPAAYISPETEHQTPATPLITQVPTTQKENFSLGGLYHGGIQGLGQAAANLRQTTTNVLDKLSKAAGNPRFRDKKDEDQY